MEEHLWSQGLSDWSDIFHNRVFTSGTISRQRSFRKAIEECEDALARGDIEFFAKRLPSSEQWRLYGEFHDQTTFLDIETTGLSFYYDQITLIGYSRQNDYHCYVKDNNFDQFIADFNPYHPTVTFNGTLFDIKFLENELPIHPPKVHLDLRYLLRGIGLKGPLKDIERNVGMKRPKHLQDVTGREAVVLWNRFLSCDDNCLKLLVQYNAFDVLNLKTLMDYWYSEKVQQVEKSLGETTTTQLNLQSNGIRARAKSRSLVEAPGRPLRSLASDRTRKTKINGKKPLKSLRFGVNIEKRKNQIVLKHRDVPIVKVNRDKIKKVDLMISELIAKINENDNNPKVVGLDLTGSSKRASGYCLLQNDEAHMSLQATDEEIVDQILADRPSIVSIDSPLSFPEGRDCADDDCDCRRFGIMREAERVLKRRGINVYPCLIPSMQALTSRGIRLKQRIEAEGIEVIESYPGAAQDILQIPRKRIDLQGLEDSHIQIGIRIIPSRSTISHDELDAMTSALVGYFYLADDFDQVGNDKENFLIIPNLQAKRPYQPERSCQQQSSSEASMVVKGKEKSPAISFEPKKSTLSSGAGVPTPATLSPWMGNRQS